MSRVLTCTAINGYFAQAGHDSSMIRDFLMFWKSSQVATMQISLYNFISKCRNYSIK
jgi:hypothetical protein